MIKSNNIKIFLPRKKHNKMLWFTLRPQNEQPELIFLVERATTMPDLFKISHVVKQTFLKLINRRESQISTSSLI